MLARIQADGLPNVILSWVPASEPIIIALDRRLGLIKGRFKLPDKRRLEGTSTVYLSSVGDRRNQSEGQTFSINYDRKRLSIPMEASGSRRFCLAGIASRRLLILRLLSSYSPPPTIPSRSSRVRLP